MKQQVFNPYLPSWEYIPDGEPKVFGDRVYVYGSHDRFNAPIFCVNDYVCWSAPVDDLSDWRYEGVIYRKDQDPKNKLGIRLLFAPDVVQGTDGRYYLYYAFDFMGITGVAVCDTPSGQYQFLGHIRYPDGTIWGRRKGDQFLLEDMVSYCDSRDNGNSTIGCYMLEAGDYILTVRSNSHDILDSETVTVDSTIWYDGSDEDHMR